MNNRARQLVRFLLISLFGLVTGFVIFAYTTFQLSTPVTKGQIALPELESTVEITYDQMGIPQIWAENEHDMLVALGYQHAADRLFQMELLRRMAQGRLSEMLGEVTIDVDIDQRRIGHHRIASETSKSLSEKNRERLQAYCDGINAYQRTCRAMPFEFWLLPIDYEPWSIHDCLSALSFQTWVSHALMSRDEFRLKLFEELGTETSSDLAPSYPNWVPTTVAPDNRHSSIIQKSVHDWLFSNDNLPFGFSRASNAWVVAPEKSQSGHAMLASDPHLEITRLPQFWYQVGLHVNETELDAVGITTAGIPAIIMGHSRAAAFAFTAAGIDITDYYREQVNPDDSGQYLTPDGWRPFDTSVDTINIAGSDTPEIVTIRHTRHGPVIDQSATGEFVTALHWAGYDIDLDRAVNAAFELATVTSFEQFQQTVINMGALNANWVYADSSGNIGYQLGVPVPIRASETAFFPMEGSSLPDRDVAYYPLEQTPQALNPSEGWLATCNNKPTDDLPYDLLGDFFANRIIRITDLLSANETVDFEQMQNFQGDQIDCSMLRWRDEVIGLLDDIGLQERTEALRNWDGSTGVESREILLIRVFLRQLTAMIFEDQLGQYSQQVSAVKLDEIYFSDNSKWIDNINTLEQTETRSQIATAALQEALSLTGEKTWGEAQTLSMRHPMAMIPIIGSLLDLSYGPWPWSGTAGTLDASFNRAGDDSTFHSIVGPSWRFVIDMGDVDGAMMVLPAGNSGNPMSRHFFDFNQRWRDGQYWNVPISRTKVFEGSVSLLSLTPVASD